MPFYQAMRKVEARTWNSHKESFHDYAIDKLIHQLELPAKNTITLLIGGITQPTLRATALSLRLTTVEAFMEAMRHIVSGHRLRPEEASITAV